MQPNLDQIHRKVALLMPAINRLLVKKFVLPKKISYKAGGIEHLGISVVTETDKEVEKILRQKLMAILPGSGFIGEETPADAKEYNWIVDPIDGTLNFAAQLPIFACSIGLWHKNEAVYGLASLPFSMETFHAIKGRGMYLNDKRVKLPARVIKKAFLTYSNVGNAKDQIKVIAKVMEFTSAPRSFGSSVFHGAQIAMGRVSGGVFMNQAIWDIAAIALFASEVGLSVKYISKKPDLAGDNLKNYQYSLVIGPEKLAADLADSLS